MNKKGFIDGGVIVALALAAIGTIIVSNETVSKEAVTNAEPIQLGNTIYSCDKVFELEYYPVRKRPDQPAIIKRKPIKRKCD